MFLLNLDICMAKIKYTSTSETVWHGNSSETFKQNFVVVIKDIPCRFACLPQILIQVFSGSYALFKSRNLTKFKYTETVCQQNFSATTEQNFM